MSLPLPLTSNFNLLLVNPISMRPFLLKTKPYLKQLEVSQIRLQVATGISIKLWSKQEKLALTHYLKMMPELITLNSSNSRITSRILKRSGAIGLEQLNLREGDRQLWHSRKITRGLLLKGEYLTSRRGGVKREGRQLGQRRALFSHLSCSSTCKLGKLCWSRRWNSLLLKDRWLRPLTQSLKELIFMLFLCRLSLGEVHWLTSRRSWMSSLRLRSSWRRPMELETIWLLTTTRKLVLVEETFFKLNLLE